MNIISAISAPLSTIIWLFSETAPNNHRFLLSNKVVLYLLSQTNTPDRGYIAFKKGTFKLKIWELQKQLRVT